MSRIAPPSRRKKFNCGTLLFCVMLGTLGILLCMVALSLKVVGEQESASKKLRSQFLKSAQDSVKDVTNWLLKVSSTYLPASTEKFVMSNLDALGYNTKGNEKAIACNFYKKEHSKEVYDDLKKYGLELKKFNTRRKEFMKNGNKIPDLRHQLKWGRLDPTKAINICNKVDILRNQDGSMSDFLDSRDLSFIPDVGFLEPILPPMRSAEFCNSKDYLMSLDYLVHDFGMICQEKFLKPMMQQQQEEEYAGHTVRTVFLDFGASLDFHEGQESPAVYIAALYESFGIPFDHVYAYEIRKKDSNEVFQRVPQSLRSSYHWLNVGISATLNDPSLNEYQHHPWQFLENHFTPFDFVVVKLDIDTPSLENSLAQQLLDNPAWTNLVDVFYFEHHVHLAELAKNWRGSMRGSLGDSLQLFEKLREKGVAAHSWV